MGFLGGHARDFLKFDEDRVDLGVEFFLPLLVVGNGGVEGFGLLLEVVFLLDKGGVASVDRGNAEIELLLFDRDFVLSRPGVVFGFLLGLKGLALLLSERP